MSQGTDIQRQIRTLIADPNIRSTLTLTPITRTRGGRGGYDVGTDTEGIARSVYAIPSNYIKIRIVLEKMGDVKGGEMRFLIRDDETVDTDDQVTFQSVTYHIRMIKPIFFNEVTVAQSLTLSRIQ